MTAGRDKFHLNAQLCILMALWSNGYSRKNTFSWENNSFEVIFPTLCTGVLLIITNTCVYWIGHQIGVSIRGHTQCCPANTCCHRRYPNK